ncbi:hypothetical protein A2311_01120 [candidate division WOR-1 bacterium RIFOXYB2_FULL_48_7]|uniref:DJ-1/PfpI domain-containing protein n=1 Tax=candidate division WOR-1 bacterium RIFOXYB2_FULL_48_7 TaxID=1802583 RepID=A0A1F4TQD9_UNCSA|nr:MAG: hypothetical protein A2311_01120 [candidate division WOR-1 bacterium RIFOXYB2_FULL_48_7]
MKKVAMVIAFSMFRDEEYLEPKSVLEHAGVLVETFSDKTGTAQGKFGLQVQVEKTIADLKLDDFAALLFVGGPGANVFYDSPLAHQIIQEAVLKGKIIGAICGAPPILARAGALKGKKATMFTDTGDFASYGAVFTGQGVEVDGRIITADGPKSATAWGEAIVRALSHG